MYPLLFTLPSHRWLNWKLFVKSQFPGELWAGKLACTLPPNYGLTPSFVGSIHAIEPCCNSAPPRLNDGQACAFLLASAQGAGLARHTGQGKGRGREVIVVGWVNWLCWCLLYPTPFLTWSADTGTSASDIAGTGLIYHLAAVGPYPAAKGNFPPAKFPRKPCGPRCIDTGEFELD